MYTLYIDTHFINLVVALIKDDILIEEKVLESNKHSENTINLIKSVLDDNNITIDDIKEVIVINGPGSFTGVRIGVVIAKILGFTKNIKIKVITYLEALSLKYNEDVIIGIKDRNGAFIGEFDRFHKLAKDYYYLSNAELKTCKEKIIFDDSVNIDLVYKYLKCKNAINPHMIKPLYVKKIEVDK